MNCYLLKLLFLFFFFAKNNTIIVNKIKPPMQINKLLMFPFYFSFAIV